MMDYKSKAKQIAVTAKDMTKEALDTRVGKHALAGASAGAVIGVIIPLVGPIIGAQLGLTYGVYKGVTKD